MPWSTEITTEKPAIPGWFAIINLLAGQEFTVNNLAVVIGRMSALQTTVITQSGSAKGIQQAIQSFTVTNTGASAVKPSASQQFSAVDSATSKGIQQALQLITIVSNGLVTDAALTGVANQFITIVNAVTVIGFQQASQSLAMTNAAQNVAKPGAVEVFSVIDGATVIALPSANNPLIISGAASVIAVVLSPQQFNIVNQGLLTGIEAIATGPQVISIVDSATVKGLQAAGQIFSITNGASWFGKPGANQILVVTESADVKGVSAANINFVVTNTGTVYATLTGLQSFTLSNVPASFYGKPGAAQSFSIGNSATGTKIEGLPIFDVAGTTYASGGNTTSGTVTISATNGSTVYVFIEINTGSRTVSSITHDSDAMTLVDIAGMGSPADTSNGYVVCYKRTVATTGSKTISLTMSAGTRLCIYAMSLLNANSETTVKSNGGNQSSLSLAMSPNGSQYAIAALGAGNRTPSSPTGGTARALIDNGGNGGMSVRDSITSFTSGLTLSNTSDWAGLGILVAA